MRTSATTATTATPAVLERDAALVIWMATTTVKAERARLTRELGRYTGVFGPSAARSPRAAQLEEALHGLEGLDGNQDLSADPPAFGATPAARFLPRGARPVGWLDTDGYRHHAGMPAPDADWLAAAAARLDDSGGN